MPHVRTCACALGCLCVSVSKGARLHVGALLVESRRPTGAVEDVLREETTDDQQDGAAEGREACINRGL